MTVRIVSNAVNALISGADDNVKRLVQEMLSYEVEAGDWKGTSTMFNWSKNAFPAGFAKPVAANLLKAGIKCVHVRKEKAPALGKPNPVVNPFPYNPDYAYQDQTVETLVREGMMIAQIATGGGKSNVACKAAARIGRMTLFLTTRSVLMFQMAENFQKSIDYRAENGEPWLKGQKVGVIGSGEFQVSRHINVATVQTLASFLEEPPRDASPEKKQYHLKRRELVKRFLSSVSLLILEEAHESSGSNFYDIARLCINADYRLALTATPFMKDSTEANMRLIAVAGRIEIKVTEKYLIDRGILAKPYFLYHKIAYTPDEVRIRAELASETPELSGWNEYGLPESLSVRHRLQSGPQRGYCARSVNVQKSRSELYDAGSFEASWSDFDGNDEGKRPEGRFHLRRIKPDYPTSKAQQSGGRQDRCSDWFNHSGCWCRRSKRRGSDSGWWRQSRS